MYGVGATNNSGTHVPKALKSQMKVIPFTPNDKTYRKVSVQRAGSLDYGRGAFAGTSGNNRFDEKYMAVL